MRVTQRLSQFSYWPACARSRCLHSPFLGEGRHSSGSISLSDAVVIRRIDSQYHWLTLTCFAFIRLLPYLTGYHHSTILPNVVLWCVTCTSLISRHDCVIKWKHFPRYWPFVRGIHRSPMNSPHKGQWRGTLMFSLFYVWMTGWVNNREAGDLRRYRAHYDMTVVWKRLRILSLLIRQDTTAPINQNKPTSTGPFEIVYRTQWNNIDAAVDVSICCFRKM